MAGIGLPLGVGMPTGRCGLDGFARGLDQAVVLEVPGEDLARLRSEDLHLDRGGTGSIRLLDTGREHGDQERDLEILVVDLVGAL